MKYLHLIKFQCMNKTHDINVITIFILYVFLLSRINIELRTIKVVFKARILNIQAIGTRSMLQQNCMLLWPFKYCDNSRDLVGHFESCNMVREICSTVSLALCCWNPICWSSLFPACMRFRHLKERQCFDKMIHYGAIVNTYDWLQFEALSL